MPKVVNIFFSRAPTMGYVFRSGRVVHFMGGQFTTSVQSEIDELNEVCEEYGSNYYLNPDQLTVNPDELDPVAVMYAKMLAQARSVVADATNPARDMGTVEFTSKLEGIANSASIIGMAVDSGTALGTPDSTVSADSSVGAVPVGSIKLATATKV